MNATDNLIPLTERLATSDPDLRYQAVGELADARVPEAIPALSAAVNDADLKIRDLAIRGLAGFPPSLVLPRLEEFLRNGDEANLRTAALEIIPRYGAEAGPFLFRLLSDPDPEIRMFAAQLLAELHDPAAVAPLIAALNDPDPNVTHHAAEALGAIHDPRAVGPLIAMLDRDYWQCYPAVVALGEIGAPEAVESLLRLLDHEALASPAIEALGKIGDTAAIPALAAALSSGITENNNEIIAALVHIQGRLERHIVPDRQCLPSIRRALEHGGLLDHLLRSLGDDDLEVRKMAVIALGWLKPAAAAAKLAPLLGDYDLEEYVAGSLAAIGVAAVPDLKLALDNPDPRARASAVRCLGWIDDPAGPLACLPCLSDRNLEVRSQAAVALGAVADREPVEDTLLEALSDPELEVRAAVIRVLGRSRSPRLPERLTGLLKSDDRELTLGALQVQTRLQARGLVSALAQAAHSPDPEIRARACEALAASPESREALDSILAAIHDPSALVRRAAAVALAGSRREEVEHHLMLLLQDQSDEVRLAALDSLGRIGSYASITSLINAYATGNKQFQISVIGTLGGIPDSESRNFLINVLRLSAPDLKCAAIESLARQGDRRITSHLIIVLDDRDWSVRHAAIRALGHLGDRRSALHLVDMLSDPEEIVRKAAVSALGGMGARETVNFLLPLLRNPYLQPEASQAIINLGISDHAFFDNFYRAADARTRALLIDLVAELKAPELWGCLDEGSRDETSSVRVRAARALGRANTPAAVPILLRLQQSDPSTEVRREATQALRRLDLVK